MHTIHFGIEHPIHKESNPFNLKYSAKLCMVYGNTESLIKFL